MLQTETPSITVDFRRICIGLASSLIFVGSASARGGYWRCFQMPADSKTHSGEGSWVCTVILRKRHLTQSSGAAAFPSEMFAVSIYAFAVGWVAFFLKMLSMGIMDSDILRPTLCETPIIGANDEQSSAITLNRLAKRDCKLPNTGI